MYPGASVVPAGYANQIVPQKVPELEWFKNLTGVDEETFRAQGSGKFFRQNPQKPGELILKNIMTGATYECGSFKLRNVNELKAEIEELKLPKTQLPPCEFIILTVENGVNKYNNNNVYVLLYIIMYVFIVYYY